MVEGSHHFDEEQDPDPHESGKLDPNPHKSDADTQHCRYVLMPLHKCSILELGRLHG